MLNKLIAEINQKKNLADTVIADYLKDIEKKKREITDLEKRILFKEAESKSYKDAVDKLKELKQED